MKDKLKLIHISIIIVSIIYLGIGIFNSNIWFDEAYSTFLTNHSITELCNIAVHDVHPILYYVILKLFTLVFGHSMVVFRAASLIPMIILLVFGYTHISKEFGKKVGIYFSFLVGFMPILIHYSTQIRMYSWAVLFVSLTAFYAYRAIKNKDKKSWILFSIFSVLSAYTHYYALFTIVMINIAMLIYILKYDKENFKKWLLFGFIQGALYIPGVIVFFIQSFKVAMGFWITIEYPNILLQILEGNFKDTITGFIPLIFAVLLYIYMIIKTKKMYKEDKKEAYTVIIPIAVCLGVIIFALLASRIRPVFITRYMIPMIGLFIFSISYILAKEEKIWIKAIIVLSITSLSVYNGYSILQDSYSRENDNIRQELSNNLKPDDIFVFSEIGPGSVVSWYFPENKCYFYNKENWDIEDAYKAFDPQIECVRSIDDIINYQNRIWVVDSQDSKLYEKFESNENVDLEQKSIYNPYSNTTFILTLVNNN